MMLVGNEPYCIFQINHKCSTVKCLLEKFNIAILEAAIDDAYENALANVWQEETQNKIMFCFFSH
jgi:hypothetical protein